MTMAANETKSEAAAQGKKLRANEKKWTLELMKPGWTMVPSVLMEHQREIGLNPVQFNILMHLAKCWWADTPPFPSKGKIARAMRVSTRTVQRHLAALEKAGLIRRQKRYRQDGGRASNFYVFTGLIERAKPYAKAMLEKRQKRRDERATPKKPELKLVSP